MEFYLVLIEEKNMKICLIKHKLQTRLTFNKPRGVIMLHLLRVYLSDSASLAIYGRAAVNQLAS